MNIKVTKGSYKSLDVSVQWDDIPTLAILTGENGAGKTQFLQALSATLSPPPKGEKNIADLELSISHFSTTPDRVIYFPDLSKPPGTSPVGLQALHQYVNKIHSDMKQNQYSDHRYKAFLDQLKRTALVDNNPIEHKADLIQQINDSFFYSNVQSIPQGVAHNYVDYWYRYIDQRMQGRDDIASRTALGRPPWEELNELFELYDIPYRTNNPSHLGVREEFLLRFKNIKTGKEVRGQDISTGESTLMRLFMLIFGCERYDTKPSIILLDEPDAHLHGSIIPKFLDALKNVFVLKFGTRVIMTTHRVETVTFAPAESLFEMHKTSPRITKSKSSNSTIAMLTENIVTMVKGNIPIFVEDFHDKGFYSSAMDILVSEQVWGSKMRPNFVEAGIGQGKSRKPGGRTAVHEIVSKLRVAGAEHVGGIIDRDIANKESNGVLVTDRYSYENYLFDPLVVLSALLDCGEDFRLSDGTLLRAGDEHKIRAISDSERRVLAEKILQEVEHNIPFCCSLVDRIEVSYTFGGKSIIPMWLIECRGHDLKRVFFSCWPEKATARNCLTAFRRAKLIPSTLHDLFERLVRP